MRNLSMQESIFRHLPNVRGHEPMIVRQFRLMGKILRKTLPCFWPILSISLSGQLKWTNLFEACLEKKLFFQTVFSFMRSQLEIRNTPFMVFHRQKIMWGREKGLFMEKPTKYLRRRTIISQVVTLWSYYQGQKVANRQQIYRGTILRLLY